MTKLDPDRFTVAAGKAKIDMRTAMAESEMADLGDMMVGVVPPLEFRIDFEEVPPFTEVDADARRLAAATIREPPSGPAAAGFARRRTSDWRSTSCGTGHGPTPSTMSSRAGA